MKIKLLPDLFSTEACQISSFSVVVYALSSEPIFIGSTIPKRTSARGCSLRYLHEKKLIVAIFYFE